MTVWVGLQLDAPAWYGNESHGIASQQNSPVWLASQAELAGRVARDIVAREGATAIRGWFFPAEDTPWGQDAGDVHDTFYRELGSSLDTAALGTDRSDQVARAAMIAEWAVATRRESMRRASEPRPGRTSSSSTSTRRVRPLSTTSCRP